MLGACRSSRAPIGSDPTTRRSRCGPERAGAAAKAGHDLVIHVTSWEAELVVGDDPAGTSMELSADATSLRVIEGTGGMQALGDDDDLANIHQTIDDEVLKRQDIRFRSTRVQTEPDGSRNPRRGRPDARRQHPADRVRPRRRRRRELSATAVVTQSAWGMKPYSALFGALKVKDEVEVVLEGHL